MKRVESMFHAGLVFLLLVSCAQVEEGTGTPDRTDSEMGRYFKNAGFEDGAQDWDLYNAWRTPIWANFVDEEHFWMAEIDSTTAYQGRKSLRLIFAKGPSLVYSGQYTGSHIGITNLKPGQTYVATFMMKQADCKDTELRFWIQSGETEYWLGKILTDGTKREWRQVQAEFTAGPDIQQQENLFQINFGRFGQDSYETEEHARDTVWVDDILLKAKT